MKICSFCNQKNSDTANFCVKCGASFEKAEKKRKSKKMIISLSIAAVLLVVAMITAFFVHNVPVASIPKNKVIVMDYLEQKYPDDKFKIERIEGVYGDYEIIERFLRITDTWKCTVTSDKTGDESFIVYISTKGEVSGDDYWRLKYADEIVDIFETSLDYYLGQGNYVYDKEYFFSYDVSHSTEPLDAEGFLIESVLNMVNLIVSSDFDSSDETKICNDIINNIKAQFNQLQDSFSIDIYFDKADDADIPDEYSDNYISLNYWEKCLSIWVLPNGEVNYEWIYNTENNKDFNTKTPFLNGKKPVISIDGYSFTLENTTPADIIKNTKYDSEKNIPELEYNHKSRKITLRDDLHHIGGISVSTINNSQDKLGFEDCKIYYICIGAYDEDSLIDFAGCSIDGLYIGDVVDEQMLIEHFGAYETKEEKDYIIYTFIDGTASVYDNENLEPNKYLRISLTKENEIIRIEYCFNSTELDINNTEYN